MHREQPASKRLRGKPAFAEVIAAVEKVRGAKWEEFCERRGDWGRNLAWHIGWRACGLTQRELGEAAKGADYATVSAAIKSTEAKLRTDRKLRQQMDQLREILNF